ncbi:DUF6044 family protein [Bradyrhizobium liaoningense]
MIADDDGRRWQLWLALAAAALFSCDSWILGPFSWIYTYGEGIETLPAHLALSKAGQNFSLWAPFLAGGVDRLSFWGNADPFNVEPLMIHLLPIWAANGLHRFLQYFVTVFFTARVVQEQFRLGWRWGALAGLIHAAFSYFTFGELFAFPSVPLLVWTLMRVMDRWPLWLACVAGLMFSTLTTFSQSDPYLLAFAAGWVLLVRVDYRPAVLGRFAAFFGVLLLADSPQFFAIMLNAAQSHRSHWPMETVDWSIDGLFYRQFQFDLFNQDGRLRSFTMTMPGLSLLVGLPLAIWQLARGSAQTPLSATATGFLRVFALYALMSQKWLLVSLQNVASLWLPWVSGIYMGRFYTLSAVFLFATGITLAAYLAWNSFLQSQPLRWLASAAVGCLIVFMLIEPKVFLFYPIGVEDLGQRNYEVASLQALKSAKTEPFRVASVLPLQPGYAYGQGFETADGWANLYPSVYRDLWLRAIAPVMSQLPVVRNIFDPAVGRPQDHYIFLGAELVSPGIGALPGEDPNQEITTGFDIDHRFNLDILRLLNVRYLLSEYALAGSGISLVHAPAYPPLFPRSRDYATGMLHRESSPGTQRIGWMARLKGVWDDWREGIHKRRLGKDIYIYRIEDALPRYRLVEQVVTEPSGGAVLDRLSTAGVGQLSKLAVVEAADAPDLHELSTPAPAGGVRVVRQEPDAIELDLDHIGESFLVIANTWSPYWRATVDGRPRKLIRTNHAQQGLRIAAGDRRVSLRYEPPYAPAAIFGRLKGTAPDAPQ